MLENDVTRQTGHLNVQVNNRPIIIASNRGPVAIERSASGYYDFQRNTGGLVTALSGLARIIDATWVSCAQGPSDVEWSEGEAPITEDGDSLHLKFLTPDSHAYEGYYNKIANPLLWFLQHSMWDVPRAPVIDRLTWDAWENGYVPVNKMFATEIANQISRLSQPVLIMLQDYHLYLAARYLREQIPMKRHKKRYLNRYTIMHFIHIPWPGPEYWGILPPAMRQSILDGLCAVDLLGFQTRDDGLNFLRTCESYLRKCSVNYKHGRVWYRNHATHVRDFPISIEVRNLRALAESSEVARYEPDIRNIFGNGKLILRIDRIEPSKNIIRGFQAYQEMLELHPEHRGKVVFLCLLVPSRLDVIEYQNYLDELMSAAGRINASFGNKAWEPVRIVVGENYPRAVAALKEYDVLLVNAIADGMNLVAKEGPIVNQKEGVLILSDRAGARQQLESGSIVISPCDVYATAEAIHQALVMDAEQRHTYAERLRWLIEREDLDAWLKHQFEAISELGL